MQAALTVAQGPVATDIRGITHATAVTAHDHSCPGAVAKTKHGHQKCCMYRALTIEGRGLGFAEEGSSGWLEVMPCQNLPKEASLLTGAGCAAAVGLALRTSSAVGGGGAVPKDEWGLPAGQDVSRNSHYTLEMKKSITKRKRLAFLHICTRLKPNLSASKISKVAKGPTWDFVPLLDTELPLKVFTTMCHCIIAPHSITI